MKCYKYINESLTWEKSKEACNAENSNLASVHDSQTNSFLHSLMEDNAFIGGYKTQDGIWRWTDGSDFDYSNWYPGKPGPASSHEDKLEIFHGWGDTYWNDVSNVHPYDHGYICQFDMKGLNSFFNFDLW